MLATFCLKKIDTISLGLSGSSLGRNCLGRQRCSAGLDDYAPTQKIVGEKAAQGPIQEGKGFDPDELLLGPGKRGQFVRDNIG